ncbi:MAG: hypothetical protein G01um10148_1018 [Parcubacteria group bacterium Gr01-1014_8]|nr:MAG: hypothetical protein G01um10148_1018 [Parcubacteria group bacterium Gr01-1014_8]
MNLNTVATLRAGALTIWLIAALAIGTELSAPLKSFLTSLAGQHWTAKSILSFAAFVIFYTLFSRIGKSTSVLSSAILLSLSAIAAGIVIFAFFVWHFLYA